MDLQSQISICNSSPNIYKVQMESLAFNDLLHLFCEEIAQGSTYSNIDSALVYYITSVVEPVGWKAVWRSTKESSILDSEYDLVVEVTNVSLEKLEAEIFVKSIIIPNYTKHVDLKKLLQVENPIIVPLTELYVISEDDGEELFAKTAIAIEHVRFFLTHLKRPWDGEDDILYSEEVLKPRLQLYFDMKHNILPKTMIAKVKSIVKEGWRIMKELNSLYTEMNVSDSEAEINEEDVLQSMEMRKKLGELQAKMEMLENPVIRSFVMKKYSPSKNSKRRQKSSPVVYVVSKQFTFQMITNLSVESSAVLEFEHSPETAFKFSSAGDKIFIYPGVYPCDTLGWLESGISVQGIGSCTDIVLEATGNSEVLLNCCAQNVEIQNVTLKAKSGLLSSIVVHHGNIHIKDCIIDSNEAEIGLLLLGGAEAILENTMVCNSSEDGIQMRSLSSLHLKSSKIIFSERHGIQIDAEDGNLTDSFTELNISSSELTNNGAHGIYLNNVPITDISLQRPSGDFTILKFFPWLKHEIENSVMEKNGESGIGISSSCKYTASPRAAPRVLPSIHKPDELNYSVLSDLLNEVNLSIERENLQFY